MSSVARWSRLLTAIFGAVVILLVGVGLSRVGVMDPGTALWPTYDLLSLETFHGGPPPASTMWFSAGVHLLIWTAVLYAVLSVGSFLTRSARP